MSVIVEDLTKVFGTQRAVDQISFEAKPGEILGFLGPNGAGKSTTMKMLTCFLEPTSGNATVCGHSILQDPIAVKRKIGYLPEHNPLYKDMYVKEYLNFVANLLNVKKPKNRVAELIEMTGLQLEQKKLIGALSKGYRQRVGLAQAMIDDPEVLILDEPTSGLDPNQLKDIRHLIKSIGQEKTLIFSTHIMQEVSALCDRVLIINRGKLVANDSIDTLQARVDNQELLEVEFENKLAINELNSLSGVLKVEMMEKGNAYRISSTEDVRKRIFELAVQKNNPILEMKKKRMDIENIFQKLTQNQEENV